MRKWERIPCFPSIFSPGVDREESRLSPINGDREQNILTTEKRNCHDSLHSAVVMNPLKFTLDNHRWNKRHWIVNRKEREHRGDGSSAKKIEFESLRLYILQPIWSLAGAFDSLFWWYIERHCHVASGETTGLEFEDKLIELDVFSFVSVDDRFFACQYSSTRCC